LQSEKSQPATDQTFTAKGFRFAIVASRWNDALVSRLMNQIASRAANDLRNPHLSTPE